MELEPSMPLMGLGPTVRVCGTKVATCIFLETVGILASDLKSVRPTTRRGVSSEKIELISAAASMARGSP
jgi:hypothetical protein